MICYQFPDRETWRSLALQTGLARLVNEQFRAVSDHGILVDEVGVVVITPAVMDTTGMTVVTPPALADGFHVNIVHPSNPVALDPYLKIVNSPSRIVSGDPGSVPSDAEITAIEADATVQGSPYTRAVKANDQNKKKLKDQVAILRGKRNEDNGGNGNGGGGNSKIKSMAKGRRN
jgi:hypothetical protein